MPENQKRLFSKFTNQSVFHKPSNELFTNMVGQHIQDKRCRSFIMAEMGDILTARQAARLSNV